MLNLAVLPPGDPAAGKASLALLNPIATRESSELTVDSTNNLGTKKHCDDGTGDGTEGDAGLCSENNAEIDLHVLNRTFVPTLILLQYCRLR